MTTALRPHAEDTVAALVANGYKVLRPFSAGARSYRLPIEGPVRSAVIVDTETTGLDLRRDQVVQLALQRVLYDDLGITSVGAPYVALEEPTVPMQDEAASVHGLTAARLAGQRFDEETVYGMLNGVALLVAHSAAFDAPMMLRRFPKLQGMAWACTLDSIDWRAKGYESTKLRYLLQDHASCHGVGHDAGNDVAMLGHCLATPFADGESPFLELLARGRQRIARVMAVGASFGARPALKARGYHWNDPEHADARFRGFKAWWKDVPAEDAAAEEAWALSTIHVRPTIKLLTARTRYEVD